MKLPGLQPLARWRFVRIGAVALLLIFGLAATIAIASPGVALAHTVARGIADPSVISLDSSPDGPQATALHEIRSQLGATYVRFFVSWAQAEPSEPTGITPSQVALDPTYMTGVTSAVTQAKQDGLKVIITFYAVPQWASDQRFWVNGAYAPNDAMKTNLLDDETGTATLSDFQSFCQAVAAQLGANAFAYECWNEPNLGAFIYPQAISPALFPDDGTTTTDDTYAAHVYLKMLQACSVGVRAAAAQVGTKLLVLAGATAPRGVKQVDTYSTSPQRFAAVIKAGGAAVADLFDGYSHHPYMPGASPRLWPEAVPGNTGTTVSLENLGVLLKMFPTKPFYLTEYGYQTAACASFSNQHVSQTTQAEYLQRAYAYVAKYKQVQMLMWYLVKDEAPPSGQPANQGFYTGLETATGALKRSWYAFAGGNTLTLGSPSSLRRHATLTLHGLLHSAPLGQNLAAEQLVVQSHIAGRPWVTVKTVSTGPTGRYSVALRPKTSAYYRVSWLGVIVSRVRHVAVS